MYSLLDCTVVPLCTHTHTHTLTDIHTHTHKYTYTYTTHTQTHTYTHTYTTHMHKRAHSHTHVQGEAILLVQLALQAVHATASSSTACPVTCLSGPTQHSMYSSCRANSAPRHSHAAAMHLPAFSQAALRNLDGLFQSSVRPEASSQAGLFSTLGIRRCGCGSEICNSDERRSSESSSGQCSTGSDSSGSSSSCSDSNGTGNSSELDLSLQAALAVVVWSLLAGKGDRRAN